MVVGLHHAHSPPTRARFAEQDALYTAEEHGRALQYKMDALAKKIALAEVGVAQLAEAEVMAARATAEDERVARIRAEEEVVALERKQREGELREAQAVSRQLSELQATSNWREERAAAAQEELKKEAVDTRAACSKEIAALKASHGVETDRLRKLHAEEVASLTEALQVSKDAAAAVSSERDELEVRLEEAEREITQLQKQLRWALKREEVPLDKMEAVQKEAAKAKEELRQHTTALQLLESEAARLQRKQEEDREERARLDRKLRAANEEVESLEDQLAELRRSGAEQVALLTRRLNAAAESAQKEQHAMQVEISNLRRQLSECERQRQQACTEVGRLRAQNASQKAVADGELQAAATQLEDYRRRQEQLEADKQQIMGQLQELGREYTDFKLSMNTPEVPFRLVVTAPERMQVTAVYDLLPTEHNGLPMWGSEDRRIYSHEQGTWTIGCGPNAPRSGVGYVKSAAHGKRLPHLITAWQKYEDGKWLPSPSTHVTALWHKQDAACADAALGALNEAYYAIASMEDAITETNRLLNAKLKEAQAQTAAESASKEELLERVHAVEALAARVQAERDALAAQLDTAHDDLQATRRELDETRERMHHVQQQAIDLQSAHATSSEQQQAKAASEATRSRELEQQVAALREHLADLKGKVVAAYAARDTAEKQAAQRPVPPWESAAGIPEILACLRRAVLSEVVPWAPEWIRSGSEVKIDTLSRHLQEVTTSKLLSEAEVDCAFVRSMQRRPFLATSPQRVGSPPTATTIEGMRAAIHQLQGVVPSMGSPPPPPPPMRSPSPRLAKGKGSKVKEAPPSHGGPAAGEEIDTSIL